MAGERWTSAEGVRSGCPCGPRGTARRGRLNRSFGMRRSREEAVDDVMSRTCGRPSLGMEGQKTLSWRQRWIPGAHPDSRLEERWLVSESECRFWRQYQSSPPHFHERRCILQFVSCAEPGRLCLADRYADCHQAHSGKCQRGVSSGK